MFVLLGLHDHNLFYKTDNTGFTRWATSCATNLAMPSREDDEVSPSLTNTPVSRYLIRPQFSIPDGPNTGRAIPSIIIIIIIIIIIMIITFIYYLWR